MKWNKALFIRNIEGLITKRFGGVQDRLNDIVGRDFAYIHIKNENPHVQQMFYDKIERSKDNLNTALVYVLKYRISQKEDQKGQGR